jgi:hypothetical protein
MLAPNNDVKRQVEQLIRTNSPLIEYFRTSHQHELEQLPYAADTTALKQGRCQLWAEINRLFDLN